MRKRILEGIAGVGLLAVLSACSGQKQLMTKDVYTCLLYTSPSPRDA